EEDDTETLAAVMEHARNDFSVITVPVGEPRTKPRALNYGLTFATGEYVTIFDAEDRPQPLQLRRAVVAFARHTEDADLGIRLRRAGYRSLVLGSTTLEEANSDYVNWNKQRSRWYKGYLQTW